MIKHSVKLLLITILTCQISSCTNDVYAPPHTRDMSDKRHPTDNNSSIDDNPFIDQRTNAEVIKAERQGRKHSLEHARPPSYYIPNRSLPPQVGTPPQ